jgi:predicted nucleotidyltransferase component of viral defense system
VTKDRPRNLAASVRQRLMNIARQQKEAFDLVLIRYALERLLYRLSQTHHHDRFVLKGAMLFQIWSGQIHRPTRDLDLLGQGSPSPTDFEQIFRDVCNQEVDDDGLEFRGETIRAEQMKEDEEYQGLRLKLEARLAAARIPIQIDIGFGDAVTPDPVEIIYPTLLEFPAPTLQAYPRETVVAEKFQAAVMLGIANSRMKDFYDLWTLARGFEFSGSMLCEAIRATFDRRKTALPTASPLAFTVEFTEDDQKLRQWAAFVRKGKLDADGLSLSAIAKILEAFLMPPTTAIVHGEKFDGHWPPGGPWDA